MNHLYHWQNEEMVKHEMQEVNRAVEQARLLQEAGLSRPSLLTRLATSLRDLWKVRRSRGRTKDRRSFEPECYQPLEEN